MKLFLQKNNSWGVKWRSDAPGLWRGGLHVICRFFWPVRIALITMPGKAFRCDKQWHFERLKQMSLVQLKWKRPCTTIKWGIPTRFVKMTFFGIQSVHFPGCSRMQCPKLMWSHRIRPHLDLGRIRRGNGLLCKSPWKKTMRKRRFTFSQFFILFPSKTDGWLTSKYTQMVPKGKPSTQTSHFWGSIAVSWLGGLAGRLKNERGNCVGP